MNVSYFPASQAARPTVQLRSVRDGNTRPASTATDTVEIAVSGLPDDAIIQSAVLSVTVSGVGAYGSNLEKCTVYGENVRSGSSGAANTEQIRIELFGNRTVGVEIIYQMSRYVSSSQYTVTFSDIFLTVNWEEGEPDPGYVDNSVLIPAKGVMLYEPKATDFTVNGIVLQPVSCEVSEEASGSYELQMQHPTDHEGRWQMILEDYIIKAPVPPFKIPDVTMQPGKIYQVKSTVTSTPLYKQLPTYSRSDTPIPQWNNHTEYHSGDHVWDTYNGVQTIFMSGGVNFGNDTRPGSGLGVWAYVGPLTPTSVDPHGGTGIYNPGVVIRDLLTSEQVSFIATYNWKYVQVRDSLGHIGYAIAEDLEETSTAAEPYTIPGRTVYTQLFRVYSVSCDEVEGMVTVNARHISYDFQGNGIFDCQMTEAEPATAIALLQGRLMNDDDRLIACPIEYPLITADWSFGNPIQALLDPDEGFAAQLQAKVLRDNKDFFVLPGTPSRIGARLAYGVNLRGVTWERSLDDLVTRIIPRAGDGEGGFLYLDELFVDSPYIEDYATIRTEVLDSKYSVGQEIEKADGTKVTLSKSEVIERMRQEAENRYYIDGADKVVVSLDVEFVLLGDTEQFAQYRNLQRVNLYDKILIDTGSVETSAQVVGYEWDCLLSRYNGISIGKVYSQARKRIPGYRVATGAITYSKLSPGLIKWVRGET